MPINVQNNSFTYSIAKRTPKGIKMTDDEAEAIVKEIKEKEQHWYFTFGVGQQHANKYCKIYGTMHSARVEMVRRYGIKWCMQYPEVDAIHVKRYQTAGEVK